MEREERPLPSIAVIGGYKRVGAGGGALFIFGALSISMLAAIWSQYLER